MWATIENMQKPIYLPTREGARRVRRSVRTLRSWRRQGMPVTFDGRRMLIEEETLLAWLRKKNLANSAHQKQLRHAEGLTAPPFHPVE